MEEPLKEPARGDEPVDGVPACACGGGTVWEVVLRSPNVPCGAKDADGHWLSFPRAWNWDKGGSASFTVMGGRCQLDREAEGRTRRLRCGGESAHTHAAQIRSIEQVKQSRHGRSKVRVADCEAQKFAVEERANLASERLAVGFRCSRESRHGTRTADV